MKNSELKPGKLYKCISWISFIDYQQKYFHVESEKIVMFLSKEMKNGSNKCYYIIGDKTYYNWIDEYEMKEEDWYQEIL